MGVGYSSCSLSLALPHCTCFASTALVSHKSKPNSSVNPSSNFFQTHYPRLTNTTLTQSSSFSALFPVKCGRAEEIKIQQDKSTKSTSDIDPELLQRLVYDSLVWSSLHGLVVGDKSVQRSGTVPGVGMVHAPFALLPMSFPESHWRQACELAPIFNELVDRVSLDGNFLQESLSRTKQADAFTSRLLDIHSKMLENGKKEEIRLGLHRSDYMLDEQTKLLLQIELNTISSSFPGLSCLVSELHKSLLNQFKEHLGLDSRRIPGNTAVSRFAVALAKAWKEYNNPSFVTHMMLQLFGKHWQKLMRKGCFYQMEPFSLVIRQLQSFISELGMRQSESEWRARQLMEQSSAIKCPSISYHSVSTKKIQQELAKTNVLERFLENKDDIAKLRKCFAGLWSLDDSNTVTDAIERPEFYAMKPQREGGGINIYGDDVRKTLLRLQMEGTEEDAAYILMQRIFPTIAPTFLMRDGICYKDHAISELGVYSTYLRNKENVIMNEQCGYLIRTKVSSSNEGGVAAGFAVLDSVYLA